MTKADKHMGKARPRDVRRQPIPDDAKTVRRAHGRRELKRYGFSYHWTMRWSRYANKARPCQQWYRTARARDQAMAHHNLQAAVRDYLSAATAVDR